MEVTKRSKWMIGWRAQSRFELSKPAAWSKKGGA